MEQLSPLLEQHGLVVVFACVLLKQAGAPIPALPAILVAGALADRDPIAIAGIVAVATLAALMPELAWFRAGRRFGRRLMGAICRYSLSPDACVRTTDSIFVRLGPPALAFAKFVPGCSILGPVLAGAARTPVAPFVFWDGLGTILWASTGVLLGLLFSAAIGHLLDTLTRWGGRGALALLAALAAYTAYRIWWRYRFVRQLRIDRITVGELRELLDQGARPLILDVRAHAAEQAEGVIPGAVALRPGEIDAVVPKLIDGAGEAIVYCSCPNEVSAAQVALAIRRRGVRKVRPLLGGIEAWRSAGYATASLVRDQRDP